jgi:transcriptional regulator MraZ
MNAGRTGVHLLREIIAQMFLGQFQHNLDDKGRLMIPARYRDLLAAGAFITQGFDKCLMVMTDAYFKDVYNRINTMNMADSTARMLRRLILSNAYPVEVDKVGRILVPQNLRGFLGIENGELTVAGQGDYFEVWTPAEWKTQMDKLQDVEANEQRFSTLDLSKNNGS